MAQHFIAGFFNSAYLVNAVTGGAVGLLLRLRCITVLFAPPQQVYTVRIHVLWQKKMSIHILLCWGRVVYQIYTDHHVVLTEKYAFLAFAGTLCWFKEEASSILRHFKGELTNWSLCLCSLQSWLFASKAFEFEPAHALVAFISCSNKAFGCCSWKQLFLYFITLQENSTLGASAISYC